MASEDVPAAEEEQQEQFSSSSVCLMLLPDTESEDGVEMVKEVTFKRDERGEGSIDDSAAELLGIAGERVRCFVLPGFERKMGMSLHMYIDLQGMEHKMAHNTNATQLYLIAHLPDEPPQVYPSSIHGPVLLSAENFKTEEYINLSLADWAKIKKLCKAEQPNAQFVPYEPPTAEEENRELGDD